MRFCGGDGGTFLKGSPVGLALYSLDGGTFLRRGKGSPVGRKARLCQSDRRGNLFWDAKRFPRRPDGSHCGPRVWGVKSVDRRLPFPPSHVKSADGGTFSGPWRNRRERFPRRGQHKRFPRRRRRGHGGTFSRGLDGGTFCVAATGEPLRKVPPSAPVRRGNLLMEPLLDPKGSPVTGVRAQLKGSPVGPAHPRLVQKVPPSDSFAYRFDVGTFPPFPKGSPVSPIARRGNLS